MDVLRENIGLLQFPYEDEYYYDEEDINEGFLGFGKKKSRWQRFKDAIFSDENDDYWKGVIARLKGHRLAYLMNREAIRDGKKSLSPGKLALAGQRYSKIWENDE